MINRTYRVNDVVKEEFLRMPLYLLANPKYKQMSLEAKFIYSLLLNRMTLSQKNDWINEDNEVYLIYTREEAAKTLNISYKKAIAAFKELIKNGLLFEHRQGLGAPNLLYVLKADLTDEDAVEFSESFNSKTKVTSDDKSDEQSENMQICKSGISRYDEMAHQDMSKIHIKKSGVGTSGYSNLESQDVSKLHTIKINNKKIDNSHIDNSQSIHQYEQETKADRSFYAIDRTTDVAELQHKNDDANLQHIDDDAELQHIFEQCELHIFSDDVRMMFEQAIERLYYSDNLKVCDAILPHSKICSYLKHLDANMLMLVLSNMRENEKRIVNPMAYLMSMIINSVCEQQCDLILSLPPQYINDKNLYVSLDEEGEVGDGYFYKSGPAGDS